MTWACPRGCRHRLIERWLMIVQCNPGGCSWLWNAPQASRGRRQKQLPHCMATIIPFIERTLHLRRVGYLPAAQALARIARISEIPTGRKPYLVNVQQIIWDRTNFCHHCILKTQDNAKLTETFSVNFSMDHPWRPHSRVLKLLMCSSNHSS